jgi:hypothetical protein
VLPEALAVTRRGRLRVRCLRWLVVRPLLSTSWRIRLKLLERTPKPRLYVIWPWADDRRGDELLEHVAATGIHVHRAGFGRFPYRGVSGGVLAREVAATDGALLFYDEAEDSSAAVAQVESQPHGKPLFVVRGPEPERMRPLWSSMLTARTRVVWLDNDSELAAQTVSSELARMNVQAPSCEPNAGQENAPA